jgi:site-specific DNA-methyltransferase (adenine-specific)
MDLTLAERKKRMPDILDAIAALSSDAVPTPPVLARAMLDLLPDDVWSDPDLKWLDPAVKSGSILREIASRLMLGLADWEPDQHKRVEHIMTNMLHGLSITKLHAEMGRRSVYRSKDATSEKAVGRGQFFEGSEGNLRFAHAEHVFRKSQRGLNTGNCDICGAPVGLERGVDRENYAYAFIHDKSLMERLNAMKFDVIVTNPPYQLETDGHGATASPIYHRFVEKAIALDPKYVLMIVPSRWFAGGKGMDEFRSNMIKDRRLRRLVDNPKIYDCFPGVKIRGGVNYFMWDRHYDGDCEFSTRIDGVVRSTAMRDLRDGDGVLVRDNRAVTILEKVAQPGVERVESVCGVTKPFGLTMRSNYPGSVEVPFKDAVPLLYVSHVGYSRPDQIQRNHEWIDRWKVLLPRASSGDTQVSDSGDIVDVVLGEPIALAPGSACVQTYFIAGMFDTREETENYANFLATKFVRFLVLQRKVTQDVTPERFRFVPMLDMTRAWRDEDLYARFGLTQNEVDHIEATIKPRSVNLSLDSPIPASHLPGGSKYRPPGKGVVDEVDFEEDDE